MRPQHRPENGHLVRPPKGGIVPLGGHIYGTTDHPQACLIFSSLPGGRLKEAGTSFELHLTTEKRCSSGAGLNSLFLISHLHSHLHSHFARFDLIQQFIVEHLQPLRVKGVQLYICTLGPSLTSLEL